MAFSGYLFDLDGTLVDTAPDIAVSLNAAMGLRADQAVSAVEVRTWVGRGARFLVQRALDRVGADQAELGSVLAEFADHYEKHPLVESSLYDGVIETLATLKSRALPLAVVTNKLARVSRPLLEATALATYFDLTLCGDEVTRGKPAPDLLLGACTALGVDPALTLMVGDSSNDVAAARAAGCPVVCVSYGYNHGEAIDDSEPDRIIDSLLELL